MVCTDLCSVRGLHGYRQQYQQAGMCCCVCTYMVYMDTVSNISKLACAVVYVRTWSTWIRSAISTSWHVLLCMYVHGLHGYGQQYQQAGMCCCVVYVVYMDTVSNINKLACAVVYVRTWSTWIRSAISTSWHVLLCSVCGLHGYGQQYQQAGMCCCVCTYMVYMDTVSNINKLACAVV